MPRQARALRAAGHRRRPRVIAASPWHQNGPLAKSRAGPFTGVTRIRLVSMSCVIIRSAFVQPFLGLIRFRGHVPKGGYDVHDAQDDEVPATTPAV